MHLVGINDHIGKTRRQISRLAVDAEVASGDNLKPPKRREVLFLMWGMWRAHVRVSRADRAGRKSEAPRTATTALASARRHHRERVRKARDRELIKHAAWERTRADTCGAGPCSTSRKHCALEAAGQTSVQPESPPTPSSAVTSVIPQRPSSAPPRKPKSPVVTVRATTRSPVRPHSATERHTAEELYAHYDDYRSELLFDLGQGPLGLVLAVRSNILCTVSLAELTACSGWRKHRGNGHVWRDSGGSRTRVASSIACFAWVAGAVRQLHARGDC